MKKLDKLILSSFIGPFLLTFVVVVFILLNQHMLRYFNDIIGKDLGFGVLGALFFYFAVFMIPMAMPLAVLLSSLITFSNLGENFELIAMKSLGVSLVRSIAPLFICVLAIVLLAFYINNNLVPKAALEAYSLLYDIREKKPVLDLKRGIFYNVIPGISIKANHKFPDGQTLKDVIIYDHRQAATEKNVIIADSGKMYTIFNGQYLQMELFNGYSYNEDIVRKEKKNKPQLVNTSSKTEFARTEIVFNLSSFSFTRTNKNWFKGHRIMRNLNELQHDMDSLGYAVTDKRLEAFNFVKDRLFSYTEKNDTIPMPSDLIAHVKRRDSLNSLAQKKGKSDDKAATPTPSNASAPHTATSNVSDSLLLARYNHIFSAKSGMVEVQKALLKARNIKEQLLRYAGSIKDKIREFKIFHIQWNKIFASSFACLSMFLIGAPLGTIIRRGGLGVPVLISIFFFVLFYVLTIMGEKWSRQGITSVPVGAWTSNAVLLLIGAIFLSRARADTRLLDIDFYNVIWDKLKKRLGINGN